MRPVFDIRLESSGEGVLRALDQLLRSGTSGLAGQVVLPRHAVLQLPKHQRTMLSPFLNIELTPDEHGAVLQGRFSPHPNVWTGFVAIYSVLGMIGFLSAMYGISEWWLGGPTWSLLGVPVSIAAIAFVYGAAVIGQGLTADEMYELRALVDRAVRESESHSEIAPHSSNAS
jgi:hypothetical protein